MGLLGETPVKENQSLEVKKCVRLAKSEDLVRTIGDSLEFLGRMSKMVWDPTMKKDLSGPRRIDKLHAGVKKLSGTGLRVLKIRGLAGFHNLIAFFLE